MAQVPDDSHFKVETLVEGLVDAMEIAILPSQDVFIAERTGALKWYSPDTGETKVIKEFEVSLKDGGLSRETGLLGKEHPYAGKVDHAAEGIGADDHARGQFTKHRRHLEEALEQVAPDLGDNYDDGQLENQVHHQMCDAVAGDFGGMRGGFTGLVDKVGGGGVLHGDLFSG